MVTRVSLLGLVTIGAVGEVWAGMAPVRTLLSVLSKSLDQILNRMMKIMIQVVDVGKLDLDDQSIWILSLF